MTPPASSRPTSRHMVPIGSMSCQFRPASCTPLVPLPLPLPLLRPLPRPYTIKRQSSGCGRCVLWCASRVRSAVSKAHVACKYRQVKLVEEEEFLSDALNTRLVGHAKAVLKNVDELLAGDNVAASRTSLMRLLLTNEVVGMLTSNSRTNAGKYYFKDEDHFFRYATCSMRCLHAIATTANTTSTRHAVCTHLHRWLGGTCLAAPLSGASLDVVGDAAKSLAKDEGVLLDYKRDVVPGVEALKLVHVPPDEAQTRDFRDDQALVYDGIIKTCLARARYIALTPNMVPPPHTHTQLMSVC